MALLYNAYQTGPFIVPGVHDANNVRIMGLIYRPDTWAVGTVYYKRDGDPDVVIPTVFTGTYLEVDNPGKSHATTEPTWETTIGEKTTDANGLVWITRAYGMMPPSETISSIVVTATHSITIATSSHTDTSASFTIPALSAEAIAAGYFEVTVRATKSNAEVIDTTLRFKVGPR